MNDKDRSYNLEREVERRFADWRMGLISEEAERMINSVEREPLGSGKTVRTHPPHLEVGKGCQQKRGL
ncbi:hypothetical protein M1O47_03410 [Dehalococcoidia bacterium]|nr:hypothetical protein [Dehalococcoidia bacterium]MCL0070616.1 hypothetical protein [Dehalococcoidia bacterium]MCL0090892.1 hypothetical protein [Dehalococcoidia bacterium]